MNIYIGNLNYKLREDELQQIFEQYGKVNSVKIIKDKLTGRSKGFGFIEMETSEDGQRAINELNNNEVHGRKLIVTVAKEPKGRE